jgi:NAD(P)-dependent dehydrogenase (short-subunit alcohol dehydrogenase family)
MGRLDGKIALIAGGGADGPPKPGESLSIGNGRATAIVCGREGARVMVADLSLKLAEETAAAIRAEGGKAESIASDISDEESCRKAVEATVRAFGGLNLLVNNVGIAVGGRLLETSTEQFDQMTTVNLRGHFLMMKHAIPAIAKSGGGAIVNVS